MNLHYVSERIPGDGGKLLVYDKSDAGFVELPISRPYKELIINALRGQSIGLPPKKA